MIDLAVRQAHFLHLQCLLVVWKEDTSINRNLQARIDKLRGSFSPHVSFQVYFNIYHTTVVYTAMLP